MVRAGDWADQDDLSVSSGIAMRASLRAAAADPASSRMVRGRAFIWRMEDAERLTDLDRELLEAVSWGGSRFGVATDCVDEELLESSPGRAAVEEALRSLVARGLIRAERTSGSLTLRPRDGIHPLSELGERNTVHRQYEGDWWILTEAGRAAIGLPPAEVRESWMNPSSGPWRVSPLIAPWCAWRFRRGKPPVPDWYARLMGRPQAGP
jgi:hypothetical protein